MVLIGYLLGFKISNLCEVCAKSVILSHFPLLGEQTRELEEMHTVKTELTLPEKTTGDSDDSHANQNSSNGTNHFHPPLPQFPSEEDDVNRFGNEIIKLTEEQAAAELKGDRAECLTESQTAGQPELSSLSENSESPLPSPSPFDSTEPSDLENKHTNENQALEEKEISKSDCETVSDKKDECGSLPITKSDELRLSTLDLNTIPDETHPSARASSPDLNAL